MGGGGPWHNLTGIHAYKAGASGTVTLPAGAVLLKLWCRSTAGGTVTIFGGDSIPIIANAAPFDLDLKHTLFQARGTSASAQIVFATTDSYFVDYVTQAHAT